MGDAARGFGAGAVGVAPRCSLCACGIARQDETKDLLVLGPNQRALLGILEHGAHRALQVGPLRGDRVFDRPIAGQPVKRGVKRSIGLNEGQNRRIRPKGEPGCEGALSGPPRRRIDLALGDPLGSKPRRQCIERSSDLVKLANSGGVDCGDGQPASAVFFDELLLLEQLQGVTDRLPRHAEHPAELFLPETLTRGERAIGDRLDQPLIGTVDQRRLRLERLQRIPLIRIQNSSVPRMKLPVKLHRVKSAKAPRQQLVDMAAHSGNIGRLLRR